MKQKLWITLITCLAYCIDKELYDAIEYLKEQVRVLLEQQQKQNKRIRLTPQQRIRIAAKARRLSWDMLKKTTVLYAPDTVIGWYNKLIAQKYNGVTNRNKVGRPQITDEIIALVIRFKKQNRRWGYQKITDQIVYLGFKISPSTVKNILLENGYDPEPDLMIKSTWHEFISSHLDVLAACDFFTVELFTGRKLIRCTVFFVIELATRKVWFAPIQLQPDDNSMKQTARIATDYEEGFLKDKKYLIHDRDPLYTAEFHNILKTAGVKSVKLPPQSPNLNAYAERFVKSIKSECLDHLILSSVEQLEYVLEQFCQYYHHERIHQSLGRIIEPKHRTDDTAEIQCIKRLGGLLKSYHRLAA
jgi:hypothetical protein